MFRQAYNKILLAMCIRSCLENSNNKSDTIHFYSNHTYTNDKMTHPIHELNYTWLPPSRVSQKLLYANQQYGKSIHYFTGTFPFQ